VLYVVCRSRRHWTATKKCLGFCEVTQDCDEEGCVRLRQLPNIVQANVIREALGIRKRREITADELALVRSLFKRRALGAGSAGDGRSVPNSQEI
jgi:hypothetical protein